MQWQTTWDRTKLLTRSSDPVINFVTKGAIGDADIVVSDGTVYQQMDGFGATLSRSFQFTESMRGAML
jgi:hypothetical protein